MTSESTTLFETLQREFCPPLDSSLVAALLADIETDSPDISPSSLQNQIDNLRSLLKELAVQADDSQQSELSDFTHNSQLEETISSWTTPDDSLRPTGGSSGSSNSSQHSFSTPLGFLQAALPGIPLSRLHHALQDFEKFDVDMWDIVANLLTEESIREMEERGLCDSEDDNGMSVDIPEDEEWTVIEAKKSQMKPKRKIQPRPQKVVLGDIRQQRHVGGNDRHNHERSPSEKQCTSVADPWVQLTSLSTQLSTLLPPHPPSTFLSFFHSPIYSTPYEALRNSLQTLCPPTSDEHTTVLFNLLDIALAQYDDYDTEARGRLISDVELAIAVTNGKGDNALDLVFLLRDLDTDSDLGIYHLSPPLPTSQSVQSNTQTAPKPALPSQPPPIPPPPKAKPTSKASSGYKPSPYQWQAVPQKKRVARGPHPHAHYIPAYSRDVNGMKTSRASKRHLRNVDPAMFEMRRRMGESMRKRNELLMEASRMWQQGNAKTRGGEVAFYFAERAREFQELARQEALAAARTMVESKRVASGNQDTIDLHGTTVSEAIVIVREILREKSSTISQQKPMRIITGRGSHSVGQVGVLKPAIRKALLDDGWSVSSWDAGLIVRGRQTAV